jgi:hypothetical protein
MRERCGDIEPNDKFIECLGGVSSRYMQEEMGNARKCIFGVRRQLINQLLKE